MLAAQPQNCLLWNSCGIPPVHSHFLFYRIYWTNHNRREEGVMWSLIQDCSKATIRNDQDCRNTNILAQQAFTAKVTSVSTTLHAIVDTSLFVSLPTSHALFLYLVASVSNEVQFLHYQLVLPNKKHSGIQRNQIAYWNQSGKELGWQEDSQPFTSWLMTK